ncbi:carbohydrate ABC transporter permease [Phytoactinopolyspora mesophila]|nr:sugar ABC transporter permease [Phytoactinopolyspora mesophila]
MTADDGRRRNDAAAPGHDVPTGADGEQPGPAGGGTVQPVLADEGTTSVPEPEPRPKADATAEVAVINKPTAIGFVAPALGLIGVFMMFPAVWALYLGLTNYRVTGTAAREPEFVGTDNFTRALEDPLFTSSLWITLIFMAFSGVVGQMGLGFTLAWLFRRWRGWTRRTIEVLVIMSWIIPGSVVAFLWRAFLDGEGGTLNALIPGDVTTEWLLRQPLLAIIVFNIWRGTAFAMLLFDAALNTLPPSHLETAKVSGASTWQTLRDIVFPAVRGHMLTTALLVSMWTFNLFTPFLLTGGGPNYQTEVLAIYVYRVGFGQGDFGFGSAVSAVMLVINLIIALVYFRVLRDRRKKA